MSDGCFALGLVLWGIIALSGSQLEGMLGLGRGRLSAMWSYW